MPPVTTGDQTTLRQLAASVSSNVDYTPWLALGTEDPTTGSETGFQGDFSQLSADDNSPQFGTVGIVQEAVNLASGSTVYLMPGTYVGQVVMSGFANLNLVGAGVGVTTIQAPPTAMTQYFITSGLNNYPILYVGNSSNVNISHLTVDGMGRGGLQYRFIGVAYRNAGGSLDTCEVKDIRNNPIDGSQHGVGVYANADDGTARTLGLNFNTISGFQKNGVVFLGADLTANAYKNAITGAGAVSFIAQNGIQFSSSAKGSATYNNISGFSYVPSTYTSTGMLIYGGSSPISLGYNVISQCQTGVYSIDAPGSLSHNTITATAAGTGIQDFVCAYILDSQAKSGKTRSAQPLDGSLSQNNSGATKSFTYSANDNILDGGGASGCYGLIAYAYLGGSGSITLTGNRATNLYGGLALYEISPANLTSAVSSNALLNNSVGLEASGGLVNCQSNTFKNVTNVTDDTPGNLYVQNCWSDWSGVGSYAIGGGGGNVDANPNADCGLDMTPNSIVYNCSGNFEFNVNIGETVTGLEAANIWLEYPAELSVASVTGLDANFTVFHTQSTNPLNTRDTVKVNLGVLSGFANGPDELFKVAMNGSTSCLSGDITMIYGDLRDSTNIPYSIPAPLASPIDFQSDCSDPTIIVNSPVTGGFYNSAPTLSLTATDDCDLNAVYYKIDGCTGNWSSIATGLIGTTYNNAAWTVPGFASLPDGSHCIRFKVTDDFGRGNADSCSYTWCFTKDMIPPAPPTNLVATPGHNKVHLTWTNASSDYNHTVVMRTDWYAGGHGYPEYDDSNAEGPYPTSLLTGDQVYTGTGSTQLDVSDLSNTTRDVYHYAAFTVDNAGNVSAASTGARSTSYWLGDLKSPFDGSVYFLDLVDFSSTYGLQQGNVGYNNQADIGPTHNWSPKGIPLTDSKVEFEDLAIFAINFDAVSPLTKDRPILTGIPIQRETSLRLAQRLTASTVDVFLYLDNPDDLAKALIGDITFDPTKLEYVSTTEGRDLAESQLPIFFKALTSPKRVSVSAAVLGNGSTFDGSGLIATISFRLLSSVKPTVELTRADIRDKDNRCLVLEDLPRPEAEAAADFDAPVTYEVGQNQPNPFNPETAIEYALPSATQVSVRIYNVVGQLVKTLVDDYQAAGQHQVVWNGTNENGERVASGIYLYRFETPDYQKTIKMALLK